MARRGSRLCCGRTIACWAVLRMQGVQGPPAALEWVFTCRGGRAEAVKAICSTAILHCTSCLSRCVCLSAGLRDERLHQGPAALPGMCAPRQRSPRSQPSSLPRLAHPGTGRGAWQPPHAMCVPGRQRACSWGTGGGTRGGAVAAEHPAAVEHPAAAARGTVWDGTGRAVAHLPGRCWLLQGSRWVPGVTQPGWHAVLAGLRACRY